MLLPLPPEKIPVKYGGQNKAVTLINGEEVNLLKAPGLAEITIDVVIPQMDYPCAVWDGSVEDGEHFLEQLEKRRKEKKPFEFIVIRQDMAGRSLFDTSLDVTLEEYKVSDDVAEGLDLLVSLTMKEYKSYGTKIVNFTLAQDKTADAAAREERPGEPPESPRGKNYTVVKGDCLWSIAKKQLGNGARWPEIHNLNRDQIRNPNLIYPGQVFILP